jgi:hypothetical protein
MEEEEGEGEGKEEGRMCERTKDEAINKSKN